MPQVDGQIPMLAASIGKKYNKTNHLTYHGCGGGSFDTHVKDKDEQGVQETIQHRSGHHPDHGNISAALEPELLA